jgi:hypothetical protein
MRLQSSVGKRVNIALTHTPRGTPPLEIASEARAPRTSTEHAPRPQRQFACARKRFIRVVVVVIGIPSCNDRGIGGEWRRRSAV